MPRLNQKIHGLINNKLFTNSYLIMMSRAVGSLTGYIFWVLAARLILPGSLGLASSVIAASLLIANLSQLGYGFGLVRFLPHAEKPVELINLAFETTSVFSVVLSLLFILSLNWLSPDLVVLRSNLFILLVFVALSMSTSLSQVVNWVFFARRKFTFTLICITVQSLAAIILLTAFAFTREGFLPIVLAYTLSAAAGLLLAFWLLFFRSESGFKFSLVIPRPGKSPFTSYLISSYITDQLLRGGNTVLQLLVLNVLGAEANAYFYITWSIMIGLENLIGSVSASFFAEGSHHPEKANHYMFTTSKLGLIYSTAACLGVGLFSKFILSFLGEQYLANSASLFLVLLISIVPGITIHIFITYFRIHARSWYLLVYAGLVFSVGMLSVFLGMRGFGLIGAGYGWLAARIILVMIGLLLWKSIQVKNVRKEILTEPLRD